MKKNKIYSASLSALFSAVIIICSLITLPAPVPFTLQTFAVFTATAFLGARGAIGSVVVYILLGALGLPVFSGMQGGIGTLLGPTGGYIMGFVLIPTISGLLTRVFKEKYNGVYMFAGLVACYLFGALWYMIYAGGSSYFAILLVTVAPFILPDIVKLFLALKLAKILKNASEKILPIRLNKLSAADIKRNLAQVQNVFVYDEIDSTNTQAKRMILMGQDLPALYLSEKQTAGRGRLGRTFYSAGGGLYMTLAISGGPKNFVGLTTLASVAVAQSIEKLTGTSAEIKWVNDIYVGGKKVCGILCESVNHKDTGEMKAALVGIGINLSVKEFPNELKNTAANLNIKNLSKNMLAAAIANRILELLNTGEDYLTYYKAKSCVLGKEVTYIKNNVKYNATALDITETGGLIVKNADGSNETLTSGEITLRIKNTE